MVCRYTVLIPATKRVVLLEHRVEFLRRTVHPRARALGNRLVHHSIRQGIRLAIRDAAFDVDQPFEVVDPLANLLDSSSESSHPSVRLIASRYFSLS